MNAPFDTTLRGNDDPALGSGYEDYQFYGDYKEQGENATATDPHVTDDKRTPASDGNTKNNYVTQQLQKTDRSEAPEMIDLTIPQPPESHMKPCITVIGVGGAGGNAVNNMIMDNLQGVEFVVANTDAQALSFARTDRRIQLGACTTQGLGAGAKPDVGRAAAEEAVDSIAEQIQGANMVFITAGMGGGTGTGAAPIIARTAREMNILTVGVVTKPFQFEGAHRMKLAECGIEELSQFVDTLIVIPNQNLFRVANEKTTFADAFKMADNVLNAGVRSITDLMIMPGLINLDFADVRTVMSDMGRAMMGTGEAAGDRRALDAAEAAIANPLLEDTCMKGAKGVLINITGGPDITLFEVDEAANRIRDEVEGEAHIIFGSCFDPDMEGKMRVSVVATGISAAAASTGARPVAGMSVMATQQLAPSVAAPVQQPVQQHVPQQPQHAYGRQQLPPQPVAPGRQTRAAQVSEPVTRSAPQVSAPPPRMPVEAVQQPAYVPPVSHQQVASPALRQTTQERPESRSAADAFIPAAPVARPQVPVQEAPARPAAFSQQPARPAPALAPAPAAPAAPPARPAPATFLKGLAAKLHREQAAPERDVQKVEPTASFAPQHQAPAAHHDYQEPTMGRGSYAVDDQMMEPQMSAPPMMDPALQASSSRQQSEDELEIPAFLRRQSN